MKITKLILASTLSVCVASVAYADIKVTNNSRNVATADAIGSYHTPCSSFLGDAGIIQPHGGTVTIPTWAIDMACKPNCKVNVYMSKDCKAPQIATVNVSSKEIGAINNMPNAQGYYLVKKNNNEVTIEGGSKANIFDLMLQKLGM